MMCGCNAVSEIRQRHFAHAVMCLRNQTLLVEDVWCTCTVAHTDNMHTTLRSFASSLCTLLLFRLLQEKPHEAHKNHQHEDKENVTRFYQWGQEYADRLNLQDCDLYTCVPPIQ
jgi:hypothetical protein